LDVDTRRKVQQGLAAGKNASQIARELGITKSTVCYHRRRLGYEIDERCNRRYDWAEVQRYYNEGHSKRECQLRFGFTSKTWYDAVQRGALSPRPAAAPLETYLVWPRRVNRFHLKGRLIAAGLKQHACEQCGRSSWRGRELSMSLHHRNGDGLDNRLENLEILCPNCHSQTPNFGSRNRRDARNGGGDRALDERALGLLPVRNIRWYRLPLIGSAS
jgi:hypothetical protein